MLGLHFSIHPPNKHPNFLIEALPPRSLSLAGNNSKRNKRKDSKTTKKRAQELPVLKFPKTIFPWGVKLQWGL